VRTGGSGVGGAGLCEVRVPTYRRPALLDRALRSLLDQTWTEWVALVLDDSLHEEGRAVVESLGDSRITYRRNRNQLGAAGNLDQAFTTGPMVGGRFACIVEDDNWLLPTFIEQNVATLEASGCHLMLRNQLVWEASAPTSPGGVPTGSLTQRTTRGDWFEDRVYSPEEIRAGLLAAERISNGGIFWSTDATTDLTVGPVDDAGLQEYCRTMQIAQPMVFAHEPLGIWSRMPSDAVVRTVSSQVDLRKGLLQISRFMLDRWGDALVPLAREQAARVGKLPSLERRLAAARPVSYCRSIRTLRPALAGTRLRWSSSGPLSRYLDERAPYFDQLSA
jgi:hypothetical protein